ncbi:hypothetical protein MMC25_007035 [Agyrium rufum]|nr:hypothetical protein [Agyrium rufum]
MAGTPPSKDILTILTGPFRPQLAEYTSSTPNLLAHPAPSHPLLLNNIASTTRDHLANERTFLSWLRLSIYLSVVSIAILLSFHLRNAPTPLEKKIALPLGLTFWVLAIACLGSGVMNYVQTARGYAGRRALVQSGVWTQIIFTVISTAIVGSCVLFLSVNAQTSQKRR